MERKEIIPKYSPRDIATIRSGFVQAAHVYLHELTHNITRNPNDFSKDFVGVFNVLTKIILTKSLESPDKIRKMKDRWDKVSKEVGED